MRTRILLVGLLLLGCAEPQPTSPEGAFSKLAMCVDQGDGRCLYWLIDQQSQWSIQTVYSTLVKMRTLVQRSYPQTMRASAYGAFGEEANARDAVEAFAFYCRKQGCLKKVAAGFGAIAEQRPIDPNSVEVVTTRGGRYRLNKADGRWGIDAFADELAAAKIRVLDNLKQVEKNAADFDEQRLASGGLEQKERN